MNIGKKVWELNSRADVPRVLIGGELVPQGAGHAGALGLVLRIRKWKRKQKKVFISNSYV